MADLTQLLDEQKRTTLALEGLLEPEEIEETLGKAVVQESFKIPKIGFIAGSKVLEGNIVRNGKARVIRDDEAGHRDVNHNFADILDKRKEKKVSKFINQEKKINFSILKFSDLNKFIHFQ